MESRNPVFNRTPEFTGRGGYASFDGRGGQRAPARGRAGATTTDTSAQRLEEMYGQPSATPTQTGRMTYDDVVMKTAMLFGVLLATAAVGWFTQSYMLMLVGLVGGLVLGLVNAFKREPSPALVLAYGAFEGLFLGGISVVFEIQYPGIVVQAVGGTLVTFAVMLALYRSGKVRVTPRFTKILLVAGLSYLAFSLVNLGLMLFTSVGDTAFGLRGMEIGGIPLGLLIGPFAIVLAALFLTLDFDFIEKGVKAGIPERYAWTAAFGLVVTLVWIYIEFLRLLAILRGND